MLAAAVLIPARLAPAGLVVATGLTRASRVSRAVRVMWRDHGRTASPNAGWTMAAMAGALGVALETPGAYRLGDGPLPPATDIARGLAVVRANPTSTLRGGRGAVFGRACGATR